MLSTTVEKLPAGRQPGTIAHFRKVTDLATPAGDLVAYVP
jgi:hypothetical protein